MTPAASDLIDDAIRTDDAIAVLRDEISELESNRRRQWLEASRAGATYKELCDLTGYSDGMICKEIRQARAEVGGELGERLARRRVFA